MCVYVYVFLLVNIFKKIIRIMRGKGGGLIILLCEVFFKWSWVWYILYNFLIIIRSILVVIFLIYKIKERY